uniref:Putative dual specificity protein kinase shkd n=1 Tax=Triatoma infestans TaxID=30076 RepID=A0A023EZC9_TRIIF
MVIEDEYVKGLVWFTSAAISVCFIITFITCLCGCRKKIPKNELLGLAGLVKITNPDENVNFNSSPPDIQLNSVTVTSDELTNENHDPSKRGSNAVATATRSLPDLPVDLCDHSEKLWPLAENNTDTNSDLYATVEDANRKKRLLVSGLTVDSYTPSQTDDSLSPYARLKGEHPYDQLEQNEHPYAQVGTNGVHGPSTSQDTTINSTPSRGLEAEPNDDSKSSSESGEDNNNIPAASAIAGSVPANHDLPYMTPPIPVITQQHHFSGDSVDSSKGYTSISVREPLSCILNETRLNNNSNNNNDNAGGNSSATQDPHYATVSDDSDEMYAAIEERQGGEYTSGSETYARITPRQALTLAIHHPPPPSASSSHSHHHNRESVSSISSSESPRRERRVANSPLPQVPPTLDDMYAKVMKKGRSPTSPEPPSPSVLSLTPPLPIVHVDNLCMDQPAGGDTYESLDPVTDPNYEEVAGANSSGEPDYASLSRRYDPPYERVSTAPHEEDIVDQPDYEVVSNAAGGSLTRIYSQIDKSSSEKEE